MINRYIENNIYRMTEEIEREQKVEDRWRELKVTRKIQNEK